MDGKVSCSSYIPHTRRCVILKNSKFSANSISKVSVRRKFFQNPCCLGLCARVHPRVCVCARASPPRFWASPSSISRLFRLSHLSDSSLMCPARSLLFFLFPRPLTIPSTTSPASCCSPVCTQVSPVPSDLWAWLSPGNAEWSPCCSGSWCLRGKLRPQSPGNCLWDVFYCFCFPTAGPRRCLGFELPPPWLSLLCLSAPKLYLLALPPCVSAPSAVSVPLCL